MKLIWIAALLAATTLPATAQQDKEAIKKKLMEQVEKRLAEQRKVILERLGKLIDDELAQVPAAAPKKSELAETLDKKIADLETQVFNSKAQLRELRLWKEDIKLIESVKEDPPRTQADLQDIWTESFAALSEDKDYEKGNEGFKKIYYALQGTNHPWKIISPYNIACGYALKGKDTRKKALDWLEVSLRSGYAARAQGCTNGCQYDSDPHSSFEHMQVDTDLDSLHGTKRWKEMIRRYKPK